MDLTKLSTTEDTGDTENKTCVFLRVRRVRRVLCGECSYAVSD